jgi:hypothetical protein
MGCLVFEFALIIFETFIQASIHCMEPAAVRALLDVHSLVQRHGNTKCF